MQDNGIDGMAVVDDRDYYIDLTNNSTFIGPAEAISADQSFYNQTVNAVWDLTDLTYVVEGTLILAGAYDFGELLRWRDLPMLRSPDLNEYTQETPPGRFADDSGGACREPCWLTAR